MPNGRFKENISMWTMRSKITVDHIADFQKDIQYYFYICKNKRDRRSDIKPDSKSEKKYQVNTDRLAQDMSYRNFYEGDFNLLKTGADVVVLFYHEKDHVFARSHKKNICVQFLFLILNIKLKII